MRCLSRGEVAPFNEPGVLIRVEHLIGAVRCDPQIQRKVHERIDRERTGFIPPNRLQDVHVIPGPTAIWSIEATNVVRLSLKQEPDDVVPILDYEPACVVERLRWMRSVRHDHDFGVGMDESSLKGGTPTTRANVVEHHGLSAFGHA